MVCASLALPAATTHGLSSRTRRGAVAFCLLAGFFLCRLLSFALVAPSGIVSPPLHSPRNHICRLHRAAHRGSRLRRSPSPGQCSLLRITRAFPL